MSTPYIGQINMFGGSFAPKYYAFCNGQLLNIAQNSALFALLGTTYGGNGVQTFALPNMQSRLSIHMGQGPGLSSYTWGQTSGSPNITLTSQTMPTHMHLFSASKNNATTGTVGSTVIPATAAGPTGTPEFYAANQSGLPALVPHTMAAGVCSMTGGSQPHSNLMPSLCVSFIIALQGIFPSRN